MVIFMDPKLDKVELKPQQKQKKKKKHVGLWVTLGIVFVLIIAPIAATYICFFDNSKSDVKKDETFKTEEVFQNAFVSSLDNVKESHSLELNISTDTFNQLLVNALESAVKDNNTFKEMFTGIKLETKDDKYIFMIDINLKTIFQTRVYITTAFSDEVIEGSGSSLVFTITDIKLGRISGINAIISKIAPNLLTDETLVGMFSSFGLSFKSDLKNSRLYYPKSSFTQDILNKVPSTGELFNAVLKQLLDATAENSNILFKKEGLSGQFDLSKFAKNNQFIDETKRNSVEWDKIKEICLTMILDGVLGENYTGKDSSLHTDLYTYLVDGYSTVSSSLKPILDNIKSEKGDDAFNKYSKGTIQIPSISGYNGIWTDTAETGKIVLRDSDYLKDQFVAGISPTRIMNEHIIGTVSENLITELTGCSSIIGNPYLIAGIGSNKTFTISPVTMTDMYANIVNGSIRFTIDFNLNGYDTYMCIDTKFESFSEADYKINLKIDNMYFGETKMNDEFKSALSDMLDDAFNDIDLVTFDKATQLLSLSFKDAIDPSIQTVISTTGKPTFVMTGTNLEDEGLLVLGVEPY